ncbi:hypothetical protein ACS0TY_033084 [Phlomoides rotata]
MAPPPSTVVSPLVALIIRILTFVSLLISVVIIATTSATVDLSVDLGLATTAKLHFNDFYAYRYMLATGVLGIAYTLVQTAFTIYFVSTGNRFGGDGLALLDFYGDKVVSYILATGAGAGFGLTVDTKRGEDNSDINSFFNRASAAASLLLIGFLFSAVSSIFSSLSLPKKTL